MRGRIKLYQRSSSSDGQSSESGQRRYRRIDSPVPAVLFFLPSLSVPLIFLPPAVHVQDGTDGAGGFGVSLSTVLAKRISGYEREFHHHRKEIAHVIIAQNYPPTKKRSCRTYPESGAGTVEYVIVLIVAVVIGAGLLGFGTKIAQQVNETGDTIGGWFGSGEDVFGAGSADQAETAFAVYSADDNSLDFYKRAEVPEVGDASVERPSRSDRPTRSQLGGIRAVPIACARLSPRHPE